MSNVTAYTYDSDGMLIENLAYPSPERARILSKAPGVAGLVIDQNGIGVAYYIAGTKSERWVAVNFDRFQAWRRVAGEEEGRVEQAMGTSSRGS